MSHEKNRRILVIDDNELIHEDFRKILSPPCEDAVFEQMASQLFGGEAQTTSIETNYELHSARQGREGLAIVEAACRRNMPFALAFVDIRMPPGWDGVETVTHLWRVDPSLQVVLCTAYSDRSWDETVEMLGITDRLLILKKPFDNVEVRQLAVALTEKWHLARQLSEQMDRLQMMVAERTREVVATRDLSVFALAKLAESRDPETGEHLERMRTFAQLLAHQLQIAGPYTNQIDSQFLEDLYRSTPLHDIGKVGIPDAILLKPGKLTPEEFDVMKQHALIGAQTLESALQHTGYGGFLTMAAEIARCHHERFDGTGYPAGMSGRDIPLAARIVALADVYDALTSQRVYKSAIQPELARQMIESEAGKHFDPAVVEAFRICYPQFLEHTNRGRKNILAPEQSPRVERQLAPPPAEREPLLLALPDDLLSCAKSPV